jgi:hypothetical protein
LLSDGVACVAAPHESQPCDPGKLRDLQRV